MHNPKNRLASTNPQRSKEKERAKRHFFGFWVALGKYKKMVARQRFLVDKVGKVLATCCKPARVFNGLSMRPVGLSTAGKAISTKKTASGGL